MKEAFDPTTSVLTTPETAENGTSTCMENNITNDVVAGGDSISSSPPCMRPGDGLKCREDTHVLSLAREDASNLDYQSNYDTSLGSHPYSEEEMSLRSGYHRQHPFFSSSDCSWENSSSASEAMPSSPDASGNVVAKMGIKSNIFGPRPDYLASYPSTGPHMRRLHTGEVKADFNLDYHSEHRDRRSDRFSAFSNGNGQSIEHINEIVDIPRGTHHVNMTTFPIQLCFDNGEPSLPRGLQYGDEIPSLSSLQYGDEIPSLSSQNYGAKMSSFSNRQSYGDEIPSLSRHRHSLSSKQNYGDEIPSLSRHQHSFSNKQSYSGELPSMSHHQHSLSSKQSYGDEIPSLSRSWHSLSSKHNYGDEIPSLSRNKRYQDKIHLHCRQSCHDAEAHPLPSYQRGASHGNGHSRNNFVSSPASNQRVKMTSNERTLTRPRVANRVVNSTDRYMINKKDNTWRNSEDTREQVCGPRSNKLKDSSTSTTEKDIMSPLVHRDQFNRSDFSIQYEHAKFFMIKSYSEDDIHKGIKYNVWASTPNGNNKLDAAFREAQIISKEKGKKCPVFLFFSVNSSGQFVGLAEVLGPVDFKKTMDFWKLDKWNGFFPVMWHVIKDIPNRLFKHIILENNDNRPVTFSRDTQEIGLPQGLEMLKLFKDFHQETSLLDDFNFYEEKENARCAEKGTNADSMHESRLLFFRKGDSGDRESMENLEASMESTSLHETWH